MWEKTLCQPHLPSSTLICIDGFADYELSGRFYNLYLSEAIPFQDTMALLKGLEKTFDELAFPQRCSEPRSFTAKKKRRTQTAERMIVTTKKERIKQMAEDTYEKQAGQAATFVVDVQYRRNATWQGTVRWLDGNKTEHFRSALELLKLMDSALNEPSTQDGRSPQ